MHESNVLQPGLIVPVPARAMGGPLRKLVHTLDIAEVEDEQDLVRRFAVLVGPPGRGAEQPELLRTLPHLRLHGFQVSADFLHAGREEAKRVVDLHAEENHRHALGLEGGASASAIAGGDLRGGTTGQDVGHVRVG